MRCDGCARWIAKALTSYGDGSEVVNYEAPAGTGLCVWLTMKKIGQPAPTVGHDLPQIKLALENPNELVITDADFGCNAFHDCGDLPRIVYLDSKRGEPWQYWQMGPCPECVGKGSQGDSSCRRCAGTANVRYYDDGFVGDERTRKHPREKDLIPTCAACSAELQPDWVACPKCGHKREHPAPTEVVSDSDSMHVR
jgi:ribosomal protein L40E